jgi:hypothetical protein
MNNDHSSPILIVEDLPADARLIARRSRKPKLPRLWPSYQMASKQSTTCQVKENFGTGLNSPYPY